MYMINMDGEELRIPVFGDIPKGFLPVCIAIYEEEVPNDIFARAVFSKYLSNEVMRALSPMGGMLIGVPKQKDEGKTDGTKDTKV